MYVCNDVLRHTHVVIMSIRLKGASGAPDLTPAETAELRSGAVAGFATAYGGPTGHTAILARALGIPAVVGLGAGALDIADGTELILDGDAALLIAEPDAAARADYA